jgi:hypothetical protein
VSQTPPSQAPQKGVKECFMCHFCNMSDKNHKKIMSKG